MMLIVLSEVTVALFDVHSPAGAIINWWTNDHQTKFPISSAGATSTQGVGKPPSSRVSLTRLHL